ncbi:MAG: DUF2283 domain-containing protein [Candidatus Aenigmatarchaeota archaeon]
MKYKYDAETDILTLQLSEGKPDFGEQSGPIITHYNKDGKPVEIEILDASDTALEMIKPILEGRKKLTA